MTFGGHIVYFVAQVASFARAQMMLRGTQNKLYDRQKSCDYHYYQYTRPNRTNSFNKKKCLTEM